MNARSKDIVPASMSVTERAAQALSREDTEAEIKALVQQSKPIVSVTDNASREVCHSSLMTLRNMRILIERKGKAGRAEAVEYSKTVIAIEKELIGILSPEEQRLADLRDAYDAEKEREKELRIAAELARQKVLRERVVELHGNLMLTPLSGTVLILNRIEDLERIAIDDSFEEFREQAEIAKSAGLTRLRSLHEAAAAHEEAQRKLEQERIELARQREAEKAQREAEAQARAQAEADAKAAREAEERKIADARADLKRQEEEAHKRQVAAARAHAQELAAAKAEQDRLAEEERARLAEETGKLAAAREAFEKERAAARQVGVTIEPAVPLHTHTHIAPVTAADTTIADDAPTVVAPILKTDGELPGGEPQGGPGVYWSRDGESYTYPSLAELLAVHDIRPGGIVHYGTAVTPDPGLWIDADDVLEVLACRANDECGEWADDYPDVTEDAKAELDTLLQDWVRKHCMPTFWAIRDAKPHTVTEADIAEVSGI